MTYQKTYDRLKEFIHKADDFVDNYPNWDDLTPEQKTEFINLISDISAEVVFSKPEEA